MTTIREIKQQLAELLGIEITSTSIKQELLITGDSRKVEFWQCALERAIALTIQVDLKLDDRDMHVLVVIMAFSQPDLLRLIFVAYASPKDAIADNWLAEKQQESEEFLDFICDTAECQMKVKVKISCDLNPPKGFEVIPNSEFWCGDWGVSALGEVLENEIKDLAYGEGIYIGDLDYPIVRV